MGIKQALKWWADKEEWSRDWGTREVEIASVKLLDSFSRNIDNIKYGQDLTVKIEFLSRETVKNPHFGVAVFRERDGLYCFGPNTILDGFKIHHIKKGKGWFSLRLEEIPFTPDIYQISIAIWDKQEFIPYNYHPGRYRFEVKGPLKRYAIDVKHRFKAALFSFRNLPSPYSNGPDVGLLDRNWKREIVSPLVGMPHIETSDKYGNKKDYFETNEKMVIDVYSDINETLKNCYLWLGIFRKDRLYCCGTARELSREGKNTLVYPRLPLLEGDYLISIGILNKVDHKVLALFHGMYAFRVRSKIGYHGLSYVKHRWDWRLP